MPVTRFREAEEARRALEDGPRAGLATFFALSHFARQVRSRASQPEARVSSRGVRRFRSLEEAQANRLQYSLSGDPA